MVRTIEDMVRLCCRNIDCKDCPMYNGHDEYTKESKTNSMKYCTEMLIDWVFDQADLRRWK